MHGNSNAAYFLFCQRRPTAGGGLVVLAIGVFLLSVDRMWPIEINKSDSMMQVDLQTYSPPQPVRPPVAIPRPKAAPPQVSQQAQAPVATEMPDPKSSSPNNQLPQETSGKAVPADSRPVAMPSASPARQPPAFETIIKDAIEAKKAYPTGRQAMLERPVGTVAICMVLSRSGKLIDSRIADSSGSILLDGAAKRLVSGVSFPPFPESYLIGKAQNEFCVRLKYELPN